MIFDRAIENENNAVKYGYLRQFENNEMFYFEYCMIEEKALKQIIYYKYLKYKWRYLIFNQKMLINF